MATYVFSDVHGHRATLDRMLERVSPADDDRIFMLGDMIDRGPDPVGVIQTCLALKGATCLKGNHEDLMLTYLDDGDSDPLNRFNWEVNGGSTTVEGLASIDAHTRLDLIDWIRELPLSAHAIVGGRPYLFAHAGIMAGGGLGPRESWSDEDLDAVMAAQDPEDLMWVRQEFWGRPTGLLDAQGQGPVVVAGHTPTPYLETMADRPDRLSTDENGLARMVRVGACAETGGVADRWDVDCGCAGGAGYGQLLFLRLDDGQEFYEPVLEGE